MITRVRYNEGEAGSLVSKAMLDGEGRIVKAVLMKTGETFTYIIMQVDSPTRPTTTGPLLEGYGSSLHSVKIAAKAALKSLGVNFQGEVRPGRSEGGSNEQAS